MPRHFVLDKYESGWEAVRGEEVFFVRTPSEEIIEFGNSTIVSNRRRTRLFAALCVRLGRIPRLEDPEVVPVDVAAAGKTVVASYLWSVHEDYYTPEDDFRPLEIAARLGVTPDTVTSYTNRVIHSVDEERIGGFHDRSGR